MPRPGPAFELVTDIARTRGACLPRRFLRPADAASCCRFGPGRGVVPGRGHLSPGGPHVRQGPL